MSLPLQSLFGVVVPGRPVMTEWAMVSENKCVSELHYPTAVADISFFLLPTTAIPPGFGAVLYYSMPPFSNWEIVGSVTPEKPSGIFRTGWSTKEDMVSRKL